MKRPRIGVNCKLVRDGRDTYYKLDRNYVASVESAGGAPILMPFFRDSAGARAFLAGLDGVLFTGGSDINPRRWGERKHPKAELMHEEKEASDFAAIAEALRLGLPTLAVCLACQELNVLRGGSLHQHVEDLDGVRKHSGGVRHRVRLLDSKTREIVGTAAPTVNSWHHQACDRIGRGLAVTSLSPDGLVEGLESTEHRFGVGVQWHPERMQDDRRQQNLFRALVSQAGK